MPDYEYECTNKKCKHEWEVNQKITEDALTTCPKCKKKTAKRLISGGVGFILEGGGWADTGYSKK